MAGSSTAAKVLDFPQTSSTTGGSYRGRPSSSLVTGEEAVRAVEQMLSLLEREVQAILSGSETSGNRDHFDLKPKSSRPVVVHVTTATRAQLRFIPAAEDPFQEE